MAAVESIIGAPELAVVAKGFGGFHAANQEGGRNRGKRAQNEGDAANQDLIHAAKVRRDFRQAIDRGVENLMAEGVVDPLAKVVAVIENEASEEVTQAGA